MRHGFCVFTALTFLACGSAYAQTFDRPLLSIKPKEQKAIEEEVLHIKPRASKAKSTIVQRTSGQRLVVVTDQAGTRVTEQGSGRMIWSSDRDAHDLKVGEYTSGGMGQILTSSQPKREQ